MPELASASGWPCVSTASVSASCPAAFRPPPCSRQAGASPKGAARITVPQPLLLFGRWSKLPPPLLVRMACRHVFPGARARWSRLSRKIHRAGASGSSIRLVSPCVPSHSR